MKYMGERVPTSYSREPVVLGGTTHEPSRSRSGGGGVDGDGSGGQSPSRQGAEQELLTPETCLDDGGRDETFRGRRLDVLGFLRRREFIGVRARLVAA